MQNTRSQNYRHVIISIAALLSFVLSAADANAESFNELYSEIFYQNVGAGSAAQVRLRHAWLLGSPKANLYIGAVLEQNLNAKAAAPLIENSASPEIGALYHPYSFLTVWTEYRLRCTQQQGQGPAFVGTSDPRAGLALGRLWSQPSLKTGFEIYGESLLIPRLSHRPVGAAFGRLAFEAAGWQTSTLSLYTELNEFASSAPESFGPTRTQARLGLRGMMSVGLWNASVFVYRPWQLSHTDVALKQGLEALFVVGGQF